MDQGLPYHIHDNGIISPTTYRRVTETISSSLQILMFCEVYSIILLVNCLETFMAQGVMEARFQSKVPKIGASSLDQWFPTLAALYKVLCRVKKNRSLSLPPDQPN